jgi:type VI secretion system secreted protein VgrG
MAIFEWGHEARFRFELRGGGPDIPVASFTLQERLSAPFVLDLSLASEEELDFGDLVGSEGTFVISGEGGDRFLHGLVSEFCRADAIGDHILYTARVVPQIWLLGNERDCRIFQDKTVKDIVSQLMTDAGITADRYEFRLTGAPDTRGYCVQYRETDFNFMSRLLEEEGIFYFFEHDKDATRLVFADGAVAYKPIEGTAELPWSVVGGGVAEESVHAFSLQRRILPGTASHRDFNFEKPKVRLESRQAGDAFGNLELYDYPGNFMEQQRGDGLAKVRQEEAGAFRDSSEGKGNCARFIPGLTFKLSGHDREDCNREWLLVDLRTRGSQPQVFKERGAGDKGTEYENVFACIPSGVTFRPPRTAARGRVEGLQTATVVGPQGQEIYTDEYGRVKVSFHWDRVGVGDEKSSCWLRVAQPWAGKGWGTVFIPRVGDEVLVDFLEGDPDRPLVTGSVYNKEAMPTYALPGDMTRTVLRTRSTPDDTGFNEVRFEDGKGKEQVFFHAQKNTDVRIENDAFAWIGRDRQEIVKNDDLLKVEHDRHARVMHDDFTIVSNDRHTQVLGMDLTTVSKDYSLTVSGDVLQFFSGNFTTQASGGVLIKGSKIVLEGMTDVTLKVGGSFVSVGPAGVTIVGPIVNINSGGSAGSVSMGSAIPVTDAKEALEADKADPGAKPEPHKPDPTKKSFVEIEMVDEDGKPVPGERYQITLPDGRVATGTLDSKGKARVEGIDPGSCKVTFPALDKDAWEKK